jgi:hypothetical protein
MALVLGALAIVTISSARRRPSLVDADLEAVEAAPHP